MMRHLIHILPDNRWGGVARYALDICRHYLAEGCDVTAFTRDAKAVDALFEKEGIRLLHAPLFGILDFGSARVISRFISSLERGTVVIHAHGFRAAFTALLARRIAGRKDVRVVMTRHKVKKGIDSWLFRRIYRNMDAMIFVSDLARRRFLSAWSGRRLPFSESAVHVIHNSINITPELPVPDEERRPVTAMFHGPLAPGKGIETLLNAMTRLKGARIRLKIMGSGTPDYVDRIRRQAIDSDVMDMIDWKKHTDNPLEVIAGCDFGVLPASKEEAFGLANLEYMACGKPQICSSNGAQPEYITDGKEGILTDPSDPDALADAMRRLASDAELRRKMGERAFATFRDTLSWPIFIRQLDRIYRG